MSLPWHKNISFAYFQSIIQMMAIQVFQLTTTYFLSDLLKAVLKVVNKRGGSSVSARRLNEWVWYGKIQRNGDPPKKISGVITWGNGEILCIFVPLQAFLEALNAEVMSRLAPLAFTVTLTHANKQLKLPGVMVVNKNW